MTIAAIPGVTRAAEADPRAARQALLKAIVLYRSGDCAAAEPVFQQVLTLQPWNLDARRLLGRCLLRAQRWADARPQFETILELAPEDATALQGLREAMAAGQKIEQARQLEQIESRRTRAEQLKAQYELREAEALLAEGRLEPAEKALLDILAKQPEEVTAAARLAELYSSTRRFGEAARAFERLAEGPEAPARHRLRAAQNHQWGGEESAAIVAYRRYLEQVPGDVDARLGLGRALVGLERCEEAVRELSIVSRTGKDAAAVQLDLARCYDRLGRPAQALAAYENVARLDPRADEVRKIVAQRQRDAEEAPLRRAFAALEAEDMETAAQELRAYLGLHPENAPTWLQLARVLAWAARGDESAEAYERYLEARPDDRSARRELAQMLAWQGAGAAAARQYRVLVENAPETGGADDLEALMRAQHQAGDLEGALASAQSLLQLRPGDEAAAQLVAGAAMRQRVAARESAQVLTAEGRYSEAAAAYRRYQEEYGADPELALLIARLHSWARDYEAAIAAYRGYLEGRPGDAAARAELAAVLSWAGRPAEAEAEYAGLLAANPRDTKALLGIARLRDQRGDDRVSVLRSYEAILLQDGSVSVAQKRAHELRREVAPRPRLRGDRFVDSDDLTRLVTTAELELTLPGRLTLTPLAGSLRTEQLRLVPGESAALPLNAKILARRGRVSGGGVGVRLATRSATAWRYSTELAVFRLDTGRTNLDARLELSLDSGSSKPGFSVQYLRREAVHDLNSGATLFAGIMGDTILASAWRPLGPRRSDGSTRFRVWLAGGASFFSRGASGAFHSNRQDRLSARVVSDLSPSASLAYVFRFSGFRERSPLYFSPDKDTVHLVSATLSTQRAGVRAMLVAEAGYERIDGRGVVPVLVQPSLLWRIRPELPLRISYRYGRSGASAFSASSYASQGLELTISGVF